MKNKNGFCILLCVLLSVVICTIYYVGQICSFSSCNLLRPGHSRMDIDERNVNNVSTFVHFGLHSDNGKSSDYSGSLQWVTRSRFRKRDNDILVFLHIQKTGGSYWEKALTRNIKELKCECQTRRSCICPRHKGKDPWIVCRYTNGGWPCGLHPDWTELQSCPQELMNLYYGTRKDRRFLFATILREPIARYLSEFRHVQRGATWKGANHVCNGRKATRAEVKYCYSGKMWHVKSLKEFAGCMYNMANNRQTRMLANLSIVGCYNRSSMLLSRRNRLMLQSAKANLKSMAYFALLENQGESQYMFEKTFGLTFATAFQQFNAGYAQEYYNSVSAQELQYVKQVNALDIELYAFAKDLFKKRLNFLISKFGPLELNNITLQARNFTIADKQKFAKNKRKSKHSKFWKHRRSKSKVKLTKKVYNKHGVAIFIPKD